jgi:DNA-binding transcriptional regulator GbsR (MarR family)
MAETKRDEPLPQALQKFILHWGEMGARWGVNRTVAQVHALLYVSARPLHAEEIAETLSVARSNVSTSLRELQAWGLVRVVHLLGERRDHFETEQDVWQMFQIILEGRKRREVDPTLSVLRECVEESRDHDEIDATAKQRLLELLAFFEMTTGWFEQVRHMPRTTLTRFVKMGDKVSRLLTTGRGD